MSGAGGGIGWDGIDGGMKWSVGIEILRGSRSGVGGRGRAGVGTEA